MMTTAQKLSHANATIQNFKEKTSFLGRSERQSFKSEISRLQNYKDDSIKYYDLMKKYLNSYNKERLITGKLNKKIAHLHEFYQEKMRNNEN